MSWKGRKLNSSEVSGPEGVLDMLAETIKGAFNTNTNSGRTQFRALVVDDAVNLNISDVAQLGGLNIDGAEVESVYANSFRQGCRVRIIEDDSPHGCLPPPKSILRPDQDDLNSIAMHPLAVSQVVYEDSLQSTLRPGDVVWVTYERGPDGSKVQNLQIMPKEYIQKADSRATGLTHRPMAITAMKGPSRPLSEIYAGVTTDIPSPTDVLNDLRSLYPGASEDFLFGLMANIEAETAGRWDPMIGGDAGPNNNRCLEAIGLAGQGTYCAIGMYQMNVADTRTAGSDYLKWSGGASGPIDSVSDPGGAMLALSNWQNQNEYVKSWMTGGRHAFGHGPRGGVDFSQPNPPRHGSWTEYVMKEFENPTDQTPGKVAGREARARRLQRDLN